MKKIKFMENEAIMQKNKIINDIIYTQSKDMMEEKQKLDSIMYAKEPISEPDFEPEKVFGKNSYWKNTFSNLIKKTSTQKASELLTEFNNFVGSVHNRATDTDKNTNNEAFTVVFEYVFSTLEPEFQRSTMQKMLELINKSINSYTQDSGEYGSIYVGGYSGSKSTEPGFSQLIENFQSAFLFNSKYKEIFEDIKKTSRPENTKAIIQAILYNLPVDISNRWIDALWSVEEQNLSYINLKPLAEKNNQAFAYLVNNFKGWENKNFLNIFFKHAYLGQSNIESLAKNIGKIASQVASDPVESLLKRKDISDSGKIDILQKLFVDLSQNYQVFNFVSDYLLNASNKKDIFEIEPFNFSKSIKNHLSSLESLQNSYDLIEKLVSAGLVDNKYLTDISHLLKNVNYNSLRNIKPNTVKWLAKHVDTALTNEEKQDVLVYIFAGVFSANEYVSVEHFSNLYKRWSNSLDKPEFLKALKEKLEHITTNTTLITHFSDIYNLGDDDFKAFFFNKCYNENPLLMSLDKNKHNNEWMSCIITHNKMWDYYEKFFDSRLLKLDTKSSIDTPLAIHILNFSSFINTLNKQKPDGQWDLKENHPIINLVNKITNILNEAKQNTNISSNYSDVRHALPGLKEALTTIINDIFGDKISTHALNGKSLNDSLNALQNRTLEAGTNLNGVLQPKNEEKESFSLWGFLKQKEKIEVVLPHHLSITNGKINLDTEMIESTVSTDFTKSDFVAKAHKEYNQIRKYLESVKDKPLNLEIKIKSDNLMLDYINFVTLIDGAKTLVDAKDLYFLENSLGTYLLESLNSYTKNINRYEVMQKAQETGTFKKMFSGKSEDYILEIKERTDKECLRWISLLEEQLELVKKNVLEQIQEDGIHEMKVRSKFFDAKFPEASVKLVHEEIKPSAIKIR